MNKLYVFVGAGMLMLNMSCAFADATEDDAKWVSQCIADNHNQKQEVEVLAKYCKCMSDKMENGETRSVTEWEKSHESEAIACENQAGWK